jgi:hypothetical protein
MNIHDLVPSRSEELGVPAEAIWKSSNKVATTRGGDTTPGEPGIRPRAGHVPPQNHFLGEAMMRNRMLEAPPTMHRYLQIHL